MTHIGCEPSLDELLDDPIMHAVLARDGLTVEDVQHFLADMKRRLRRTGTRRDGSPSRRWSAAPGKTAGDACQARG